VIAIGVVLLTVAVKLLLTGLGEEHPFVLLTAAVALAAWYGGRGPGLVATVLVSAATGLLFLPNGDQFSSADLIGLAALLAEGVLVVALTVALRSARDRAEAAQREASFALAVRDEMLTLWTRQLRGPMADLEAEARSALSDLQERGGVGEAERKLRKLIEDAARVSRATERWDRSEDPLGG
jgi:K+-sensing histidine kinase KdpD